MKISIPTLKRYSVLSRKRFLVDHSAYDDWYIIILEEGEFTCKISGKTDTIEPNEAIIFPPGAPFDRKALKPIKIHYMQLEFPVDDFELKTRGCYFSGKIKVSHDRIKTTLDLLSKLEPTTPENFSELCNELVRDLWVCNYIENIDEKVKYPVTGNSIIAECIKTINANFRDKLYVSDFARMYGMTPVQFSRLFFKETHYTPSQYIAEVRLVNAKNLLLETESSIGDISAACGYDNQFYFHNRFKLQTGMSPTEYRKKNKL